MPKRHLSKHERRPIVGCAFDPDQRNSRGIIQAYIDELEFYRPRGFSKLRNEMAALLRKGDNSNNYDEAWDYWTELCNDADQLLSEHANKYPGGDHIIYGPFEHGGAIGFYINIEGAKEDADLIVDDTSDVPRGFSGLVLHVNDHGNVTAYRYSRGRSRELWAVV